MEICYEAVLLELYDSSVLDVAFVVIVLYLDTYHVTHKNVVITSPAFTVQILQSVVQFRVRWSASMQRHARRCLEGLEAAPPWWTHLLSVRA